MERQVLLSRLEDSNDGEERERCRAIAKWIKRFLGTAREYIIDMDRAERHPEKRSEPDPMGFDSEGQRPLGEDES